MSPFTNSVRCKLALLAIIVIFSVGLYALFKVHRQRTEPVPDKDTLALLSDAYKAVLSNYVETPDSKKLAIKMVDGMLATLDPHSAYLPPEPLHDMQMQMSGSFGGVGIELGTKDGKLTVIAPIDDTPASRAGIIANDHIAKIDNTSTHGMNIGAAVKLMRGEKGTPVTLAIMRGDNARPLQFNLVRDLIKLKSLKSRLLDSGYGFIRISQFQERTGSDFKEALKDLHEKSGGMLNGLVLDLRHNPGGLITTCIEVANCFIGDDMNNTVIVSIKGRTPQNNKVYNATLGSKEPRYPIVILVNGGSASASEIVAGAMQDHKRAIVMGTRSFGKGSVQSIIPMKGDAALKLTTALYYTPSGRSIQAKGIVPDIEVPVIKVSELAGTTKKNELKEKDLENRLTAPVNEKETEVKQLPHQAVRGKDQELQNDFQLRRAVELLQSITLMKERGLTAAQ